MFDLGRHGYRTDGEQTLQAPQITWQLTASHPARGKHPLLALMEKQASCHSAHPATGARRASYGGPTCGKVGRGPAPLGTAANSSPAQASSWGSGCAPSTASAMRSALYWPLCRGSRVRVRSRACDSTACPPRPPAGAAAARPAPPAPCAPRCTGPCAEGGSGLGLGVGQLNSTACPPRPPARAAAARPALPALCAPRYAGPCAEALRV